MPVTKIRSLQAVLGWWVGMAISLFPALMLLVDAVAMISVKSSGNPVPWNWVPELPVQIVSLVGMAFALAIVVPHYRRACREADVSGVSAAWRALRYSKGHRLLACGAEAKLFWHEILTTFGLGA